MKLINLLEMPYLALHSDLEDINTYDKSKKFAKKEYKLNNGFSIYLDTNFSFANSEILCITDDSKETKSTVHVIGEIELNEMNSSLFRFTTGGTFLNEMVNMYADEIFAIEIAQINEKYMSKGIISNVYLEIAKHSIIVSDNLQYEGGKALWKKLAKIKPNNIKCLVYSEKENGRVFEDENGIIDYNGSNIDDSEIWTSKYVRLMLIPNQYYSRCLSKSTVYSQTSLPSK